MDVEGGEGEEAQMQANGWPREARRILFPEIRRVEWERVPLPERLAPREVLVRAACSLISAGTEIAAYSGSHIGYSTPGSTFPRMPMNPGYALAGTVEAVGDAVTGLRPGDRVSGGMRHGDWLVVEDSRSGLLRLPDEVTFEQACLARVAVFPFQGVRLANLRIGEHVVVFGQGLIGQLARQFAAIDGAVTTMAVDLVDARLEVARRHGATHIVNPGRDDVPAAILTATAGQGADVAIEATGSPQVVNDALQAVGMLGRVILLGSTRGRVEIDPYNDIHRKGVSVIGAHGRTASVPANPYHRWTGAEHHRLAVELFRQGRLKSDGLISHHIPAAEALGIFDALMERSQAYLGVIVRWSDAH
jgi:2-desacetyl-2-hydroxyethyl bacteriochlorophyllide A dehydrogenase